ncbi:MAG: uroporphyrinogen decarboxylase [Chloroflexi bacterium]|nr:uroporphyrinogen decarboxylase [Chloroflexota bacterium]
MNPLTHRERIHAALRGDPVDRVPVALWRHFPNDDLRAEGLAARAVEFQNKYDFDLVKVTQASGYPAEMYGATFRDGRNREGTREYLSRPVNALGDWDKIVPLDTKNPVFVREAAALKQARARIGTDVAILPTIFSPLNSAHNLAGERLVQDLREHPDVLHRALKALTETTSRFVAECLRSGADAVYFATQMATPKYLTEDEFRKFGEAYDLQVLEAARAAKPDLILLHIHGLDIYFDALSKWPVDVVNWHDRRTAPSLKEARAKVKITLAGGMNEWDTLAAKSAADVAAQVREAVGQTGGRGFIAAAGCVIPVDTPEENIRAAVNAVRDS